MRTELVSLFGPQIVDQINAVAQLAALVIGALGYYQSQLPQLIGRTLPWLAKAKALVFIGRFPGGVAAYFGEPLGRHQAPDRDSPFLFYASLSTATIVALVLSGRTPLYWAAYPFLQVYRAFTVWASLTVSWSALLIPVKSVGLLVWFFLSLFLLYTIAFGSMFKATLWCLEASGRWLSPGRLNALLFAAFVISSGLALATSVDF